MSEKVVSDQEGKVLIESIDFECPSCASCFSEESQWITELLEARKTTCPNCESELLIGAEEEGLLAAFMKKKERFGKAMFVFMVPYAIGGAYRIPLLRRTRLSALYARRTGYFLSVEDAI